MDFEATQLYNKKFYAWQHQKNETGRLATRTRFVEVIFTPGRIQARGRKEKNYKKW